MKKWTKRAILRPRVCSADSRPDHYRLRLSALGDNGDLYSGYIKGNTTLGGNLTLTDPAARDLYNDLIFASGEPGSASGSGYGSFYTGIRATGAYAIINGVDDTITGGTGETHTLDELRPIGNIKWVLHDGVLVITNDWTDAEVEAKINRNVDETHAVHRASEP